MENESAPPPPARPRKRRAWLLKIGVELVLITAAVFLALLADEWRQNRTDRQLAHESLRRFRQEVIHNRDAVARVMGYHAELLPRIRAYLDAKRAGSPAPGVSLQGVRIAWFDTAAWDLALATEAMAHIDEELALALTDVYGSQKNYHTLTQGLLQAMYLRPIDEGGDRFLQSLAVYYGDMVEFEPQLIRKYDEILPKIDAALGR